MVWLMGIDDNAGEPVRHHMPNSNCTLVLVGHHNKRQNGVLLDLVRDFCVLLM